jgi:PAS domain S-box-containing protein
MDNTLNIDLLKSALENSTDIFIITNKTADIEYVNSSFTHITGYEPEEVVNKNITILKSNKQHKNFYKSLWTTINRGDIWQGSIINKKKDDTFYYADMKIIPVKSADNLISKFIVIQKDLTEFVRIEKELIMKTKDLSKVIQSVDRMVSVIQKEVKIPLSYIKGFIDVISDHVDVPEEIKSYLNMCSQNVERLEKLLQDLSNIPKMKKPHIPLSMSYTDLGPLVSDVLAECKNFADKKNITLSFNRNEDIHRLYIDINKIKEVLYTIIIQGVKSSKEGSSVNIFINEKYGFIDTKIIDSGPGLSPNEKEILFKADTRGTNLDSTEQNLPLYLCKDIIENHDGRILVENVDSLGLSFILRLPIEKRWEMR